MSDAGEYLAVYLAGPGKVGGIGAERGKPVRDGIAKYTSPFGSTRYVFYLNGAAVAALQVVSADKKTATVANVYTAPSSRRMGLASQLLARARKDFRRVDHASDLHLSAQGKAWRDARR